MLASKLGLATLSVTNELPHQVFSGRRGAAKVLGEIVWGLPSHIQLQPPHPPAPSPPEEEKGRKKSHDLTRRVATLLSIERNKNGTLNPQYNSEFLTALRKPNGAYFVPNLSRGR